MDAPAGVKTSKDFPIPHSMKAWVLGDPGELKLTDKPVPVPKRAEVLVRIDAAAICATDLEVIYQGPPGLIQGGLPFNKNFTPGHEYMGTVVALGPGVDEYNIGQRVAVRDSRRLRPVQALPRGHVHLLPQLRPQLRRRRQGPPRQRLHHRRRVLRIPGQQHQHAGRDFRRHVGRGGRAGRHRRHGDVCADRTRRSGRRRKRGGQRRRADRPDGGRGGEGARRPAGDPHRDARRPHEHRAPNSAPTPRSISARSRTSLPR